jgi:hypothetical protein
MGAEAMMTEAEAKKKWCPHIRITTGVHESMSITNRCDTPTMTNCIASECMAWRWANERGLRSDGASVPVTGYCGLAGKP